MGGEPGGRVHNGGCDQEWIGAWTPELGVLHEVGILVGDGAGERPKFLGRPMAVGLRPDPLFERVVVRPKLDHHLPGDDQPLLSDELFQPSHRARHNHDISKIGPRARIDDVGRGLAQRLSTRQVRRDLLLDGRKELVRHAEVLGHVRLVQETFLGGSKQEVG